jgi:hypothetical protein
MLEEMWEGNVFGAATASFANAKLHFQQIGVPGVGLGSFLELQ